MIEITKHELFKIFSRKSIYLAAVLFTILFGLSIKARNIDGYINGTYTYYKGMEGRITQEKVDLVQKQKGNSNNKPQGISLLYSDIMNWVYREKDYSTHLDRLKTEISSINKNSFAYKSKLIELNLLERAGNPGYLYYNLAWSEIAQFPETFGFIFAGALILLGLSSVFTDEYIIGMDSIILSSRYGKSKAIAAKVAASILYIVVISVFFYIINIICNVWYYGSWGWNSPSNTLHLVGDIHYSINVWQYCLLQLLIQITGSIALGMIVLALSAMSRHSLIPMFTGGILLALPDIITKLRMGNRITLYIQMGICYMYQFAMKVTHVFPHFYVINILGEPVDYLAVVLLCTITTSLTAILCAYVVFRNHQVIG